MKTWLFHKWERIPPDWQPSNWDIIFFLPADLERNIHSSRVWSLLVFELEIPHHFSWVSGCQTWTGTDTISSPGSLASNSSYRSGELSASVTIWANSLHILYTSYIYIFIYTHYMHTHTHLISSVSLENHDEYTISISVVKYLSYPFPWLFLQSNEVFWKLWRAIPMTVIIIVVLVNSDLWIAHTKVNFQSSSSWAVASDTVNHPPP